MAGILVLAPLAAHVSVSRPPVLLALTLALPLMAVGFSYPGFSAAAPLAGALLVGAVYATGDGPGRARLGLRPRGSRRRGGGDGHRRELVAILGLLDPRDFARYASIDRAEMWVAIAVTGLCLTGGICSA